MKVYADTSIFGGVFDKEFSEVSKKFFDEVKSDRFTLMTSALVEAEIEPAPEKIRSFFRDFLTFARVVEIKQPALQLRSEYIRAGIVTQKSMNDALHVAIASVNNCNLIVSWNFKHIVHFDKIPKYNAITILKNYNKIGIYSPMEVIDYEQT